MKGRWILAIIAANLAVLVALAFAYPHLMVAPGALVPAHATLTTNCFACHAPLRGVSSDRCMACHALPDIGLRTTRGVPKPKPTVKASFHQQLIAQDCMACHNDHQGVKLSLRQPKTFSHALLKADVRQQCDSCHTAPKTAIHRELTAGCGQCHQSSAWKPATFEHDKLFLLDGDHNASCVTCHVGNNFQSYTCFGCHEHTPANIRAEHEEEGIRNIESCVSCHRSASDDGDAAKEAGRKRD